MPLAPAPLAKTRLFVPLVALATGVLFLSSERTVHGAQPSDAGARVPATAELPAKIDWPAFLGRHDLVWKKVPRAWKEGAPLGNGLLGAMVFSQSPDELVWQLGRTDVTDHQSDTEPIRARPRLPIGHFVLRTKGAITGTDARLDLWNAEWTGRLKTAAGTVEVSSFIHATEPLIVIELRPAGGERGAELAFRPDRPFNDRFLVRSFPITPADIHPAPFVEERGDLRVSVQKRNSGGEWAVAWQIKNLGGGRRWAVISIADSHPKPGAREEAARAVTTAMRRGLGELRRSHRRFWHGYYPASFLSLPDPRVESFYWLQMYKLAAATRADRPAIDTMGPWYEKTPWPGIWWNLNIQLSYWPVYTANRLSLGESMLRLLDENQANLRKNVPPKLRQDSMAVGRLGGPDAISPVEYMGARKYESGAHEMGNLLWVMHNYWLHWRHNMDPTLLRERLYPLLKASVSYLLHRLKPDAQGVLHVPEAVSPEFPKPAPDTNYDLSLLRWGLKTLLELDARLGTKDPLAARWRSTLAKLVPYPQDKTGYLIGRNQPLDESHRHFSHLLMIYPLRLVTGKDAAERALIERSTAHWIGFEGALQGYSFVGASAIASLLGKGDEALGYLDELLGRYVHPNTMYSEAGPVIETPLAAAHAVHEMLLQSWGDTLRVFPALPGAWKDVQFRDLRAEGAFLLSAVRRQGRTVAVRVESLAGEPTTLVADVPNAALAGHTAGARKLGEGRWRLELPKGQALLVYDAQAPAGGRRITPVDRPANQASPFGLR